MGGMFWRVAVQLEGPLRQDSVVDMVTHAGPVVQGVLYLLLVFSVVSWGIVFYKFLQIRQARRESGRFSTVQSSRIQAVAPGIAESLIATAVGLSAAIPAVMAYNYFSRQVRVLAADMENFSAEFLNIAERHFL